MSDWTYEKRALWRYFEVNDFQRSAPTTREDGRVFGGHLLQHSFASDEVRYTAWLYDSLLWSIEMIEGYEAQGAVHDLLLAFRGYTQAAGYLERVRNTSTSDIFIGLKNYFEGVLQSLHRERDEALLVMQDCLDENGQLGPSRASKVRR